MMPGYWQRLKSRIQPTPRLGRWLTGLAILAGAGIISSILFATGPSPVPEAASEKSWPVSTVVATPRDLAPSFTAYGRVEARNLASLSADLTARVTAIHVKEGEWVEAGAVIIELDDGELALDVVAREAELRQRRANVRSIESELAHLRDSDGEHRSMLKVANAKLARHEQLRRDRLISDSLYDEVLRQANEVKIAYRNHSQRLADLPNRLRAAEALKDGAAAALARAQLIVDKTRLRAPFDGVVLSVPAAIGSRAQPGMALVQIADIGAYEVRVAVPPAYSAQFSAALQPETASSAISAHTADGVSLGFSRLAGAVQSGHTSADAIFSWLPERHPPAPVGTTIELQVQLPPAPQVVALPPQSLYENQRVYVVERQRLRAVAVERVGERRTSNGDHQVLVRSPELLAGAQVITTQLPKAMAGLKVEATGVALDAAPPASRATAAAAARAEQITRDKQRQVIKAAVEERVPAEISLPTSSTPDRKPDARERTGSTDQRVSSRRYRMA